MSLFQKSIEEKCLDELDPEPDISLATELKNITNSTKIDCAILKSKYCLNVEELQIWEGAI